MSDKNTNDFRVLIKICDEYNTEHIQHIIADGMKQLNYKPEGKIFVKPNAVYATKKGKYGSTAYTNASFVKSALTVLSKSENVERKRPYAAEDGSQVRPRRPGPVDRPGAMRAMRTDDARVLRDEVWPCSPVSVSRGSFG